MSAQNLDPSLRGRITQDQILTAIADRLLEKIEIYTDANCWISDDPVPLSHPSGDEFCTVSLGSGSFVSELFDGAGADTLTEMGSVIIAPTVPIRGDRPRRRRRRISSDPDGKSLLNRKYLILKALFSEEWEPADGVQPLLRDMPHPVSCSQPGEVHVGDATMLQLRIVIQTTFDWDLA